MKKLRYIGPHDAVSLPLDDGSERLVARNTQIDLNDDLAASLLEQETNWQAVQNKTNKEIK